MWLPTVAKLSEKMHETQAALAGGIDGHFLFLEHLQGCDDAIYAAARLLELVAQQEQPVSALCAAIPGNVASSVYTLPVPEKDSTDALFKRLLTMTQDGALGAGPFASTRVTTIDGVRVDFTDGWFLLRPDPTQAKTTLELRMEGQGTDALARIQDILRDVLRQLLPAEQAITF